MHFVVHELPILKCVWVYLPHLLLLHSTSGHYFFPGMMHTSSSIQKWYWSSVVWLNPEDFIPFICPWHFFNFVQTATWGGKGQGWRWVLGISREELQLLMGIIVVLFKVFTGHKVLLQNIFLCKLVCVWLCSSIDHFYMWVKFP